MTNSHFSPTTVKILSCHIKGVDVTLHINCIRVFESMCKPYITAQIMVVDNNNMINGLELQGGDRITFAFQAYPGTTPYEQTQYILSLDGEESTENLRTVTYTIYTAGLSYFLNQGNLVQMSAVNTTGSALAARIHSQYVQDGPLTPYPSTGMIATDAIGGYQINNKRPFKAITDVLDRSVASGVDTGSWVYFRDRRGHVMAPLELLFAQMSAQETFYQKQWGTVFEHTLQGADGRAGHNYPSWKCIMAAKTVVKEKPGVQGRGAAGKIAAAAAGQLNIHDPTELLEQGHGAIASAVGNIGGSSADLGAFATGKYGGKQGVFTHDSRAGPIQTNQLFNANAENAFQAAVKDSVNYLVKVPFQSGINVTVGKGADAKLIPPFGDVPRAGNRIGGLMLTADVMHECYFDQRLVQGTTTMRLVSGYKS